MDKRELVFTILLILAGIAGFIYSVNLPSMGPIALSPGLFPGIVTGLIVILCGVHLGTIVRENGKKEDTEPQTQEEEKKRSIIILVIIFILYLIMLHYLHFIISTIIFLLGTMTYLYKRFHWKIPVISISMVLMIYYLFRYLLHVRLP